jgi:hypothetical protein
MSDPHDEKLDHLLRARRIEPASSDLTERIPRAAAQRPQSGNLPFWYWLRDIFREFHLPQPGYVLAGALLVGMAIGFNTPSDSIPTAVDSSVGIQSFLSSDEALL